MLDVIAEAVRRVRFPGGGAGCSGARRRELPRSRRVRRPRPIPSSYQAHTQRAARPQIPRLARRSIGMALNQLRLPVHDEILLSVVTAPTPVRKRSLQLLGVMPDRIVPKRLPG